MRKRFLILLASWLLMLSVFPGCSSAMAGTLTSGGQTVSGQQTAGSTQSSSSGETAAPVLPEDGSYNSKEEVALYLHLYGHLPQNYITKKEAQNLGWSGGSLEKYAPGKSIGGSRFGNYEGILPEKDGRQYFECDIDTLGEKKRGAKRIVWSSDGLIYYTEDHYETFELLYESDSGTAAGSIAAESEVGSLPEDGTYNTKEEVALYLHLYAHLPGNYITKKDAQALGWSGGSLEPYAPGKSIGGSRFGNYEGILPEKKGRQYFECDIDTQGKKSRGAKRIVWSSDGLIYYTEDHYETFELLYGEE